MGVHGLTPALHVLLLHPGATPAWCVSCVTDLFNLVPLPAFITTQLSLELAQGPLGLLMRAELCGGWAVKGTARVLLSRASVDPAVPRAGVGGWQEGEASPLP